jgi:glycine/D-amino acid oxidase-like deaminating enzyme
VNSTHRQIAVIGGGLSGICSAYFLAAKGYQVAVIERRAHVAEEATFGDSGLRPAYLSLALLTTALVLWRHRSNLQRLMAGTEPKLGAGRS